MKHNMTRNERKQFLQEICIAVCLICAAVALILCITKSNDAPTEAVPEEVETVIAEEPMIMEEPLDENESEKIADAIMATYGTDKMIEAFGYDFDKLVQIITAEAGSVTKELCSAIAQCVLNGCYHEKCLLDPIELCEKYQYASPKGFTTYIAFQACSEIMVRGQTCEAVEDALYFYNSKICQGAWHETQEYIITYDLQTDQWIFDPGKTIDGIRFFK